MTSPFGVRLKPMDDDQMGFDRQLVQHGPPRSALGAMHDSMAVDLYRLLERASAPANRLRV